MPNDTDTCPLCMMMYDVFYDYMYELIMTFYDVHDVFTMTSTDAYATMMIVIMSCMTLRGPLTSGHRYGQLARL